MYQIDFNKPVKVHFIGIGGISMSGLAEILRGRGFEISGSDIKESDILKHLEADGVKVVVGQKAENINTDMDVVVYTAAVHAGNPEFDEAVRLGVPMLSRAELLGQIMSNYELAIAVAGTHGKTTTTAMVSEILVEGGCDPTISLGGMLDTIGGNIRVGSSSYFIAEACEYTNSFLSFYPDVAIILNVRKDHLDFFADIDDIRHSFRLFAQNVRPGGLLIVNSAIEGLSAVTEGLSCRINSVGLDACADYYADGIDYDARGCASFTVHEKSSGDAFEVTLNVPGEHNVENALAAIAACRYVGLTEDVIAGGLLHYGGAHRRFELKGKIGGITVIDDYAHHPDEIEAALKTARKCNPGRVVCIFQPHTYSRTKQLLNEFAKALSMADEVILTDIYAARETDTLGVSSAPLADLITGMGTKATFIPSFEEVLEYLLKNSANGDMLITMGAGDVDTVAKMLVGE